MDNEQESIVAALAFANTLSECATRRAGPGRATRLGAACLAAAERARKGPRFRSELLLLNIAPSITETLQGFAATGEDACAEGALQLLIALCPEPEGAGTPLPLNGFSQKMACGKYDSVPNDT